MERRLEGCNVHQKVPLKERRKKNKNKKNLRKEGKLNIKRNEKAGKDKVKFCFSSVFRGTLLGFLWGWGLEGGGGGGELRLSEAEPRMLRAVITPPESPPAPRT